MIVSFWDDYDDAHVKSRSELAERIIFSTSFDFIYSVIILTVDEEGLKYFLSDHQIILLGSSLILS